MSIGIYASECRQFSKIHKNIHNEWESLSNVNISLDKQSIFKEFTTSWNYKKCVFYTIEWKEIWSFVGFNVTFSNLVLLRVYILHNLKNIDIYPFYEWILTLEISIDLTVCVCLMLCMSALNCFLRDWYTLLLSERSLLLIVFLNNLWSWQLII